MAKTNRIGAGKYRAVTGIDGIAEKRLHHSRIKSYLGIKVAYPMRWYTYKFLTRSVNQDDLRHFQRFFASVPEPIRSSFARVLSVKKEGKEWVLQQKLIQDFDGTVSRSLAEKAGRVSSPFFWKRFEEVLDFLVRNRIPLLDLQPQNVLVKRLSADKAIPVLFDYKRMSGRYYPAQPWLWFKRGQKSRVVRGAKAIRQKFASPAEQSDA